MRNLILILGDQLSQSLAGLVAADPARDAVIMAEVYDEATYTRHHKKKLVLVFSAMRHFAETLRSLGWTVHYQTYGADPDVRSLEDAVAKVVTAEQPDRLVTTECGEWRLDTQIRSWSRALSLPVDILEDGRFIASKREFAAWAENRQQLRMEYFYREMRRKTGLLMTPEGDPEGGQWNFDADNRRKWSGKPPAPAPFRVEPDTITTAVIEEIDRNFPDHFGTTEDFHFAVTAADAEEALGYFLDFALPCFGDYQDALSNTEDWLFHSVLSPYLNCGLLDPLSVCEAAAQRYYANQAPLNAVEGFVRQIIGWREYVRGVYWLTMPEYARRNYLENSRHLPWFYWSGNTAMQCMRQTITASQRNGYAHHIQRLMVTGNFALLAGVVPEEISDWYLAVYVDAYDWVELPNTLGMVMYADGGYLGSKPYAASGKYIQRQSDYCNACRYNVNRSTEDDACPFNALYWHFIDRHRERFAQNPRMRIIYRNWDRQKPERREALLARGDWLLENLDTL